jgi:hypothetical protein
MAGSLIHKNILQNLEKKWKMGKKATLVMIFIIYNALWDKLGL